LNHEDHEGHEEKKKQGESCMHFFVIFVPFVVNRNF